MPKELFIPKAFTVSSRRVIRWANAIIDEYRTQGFVLTLRQLYYQFVHRGHSPNTLKDYKRLGSIINDARLAGLIDWDMIEDRTRSLSDLPQWIDPTDVLKTFASDNASSVFTFRTDIWATQPVRPEVWIEKEALTGVIESACRDLRVPYFACRGYTSQSEQWRAG